MSAAADIKLPGWKDEQVDKAVASLLKFIGKQQASSKDLFGEDEEVLYLQLALRAMPQQARKDKPVPLPLPHPIWSSEGAEICLFVKDVEVGAKGARVRGWQAARRQCGPAVCAGVHFGPNVLAMGRGGGGEMGRWRRHQGRVRTQRGNRGACTWALVVGNLGAHSVVGWSGFYAQVRGLPRW